MGETPGTPVLWHFTSVTGNRGFVFQEVKRAMAPYRQLIEDAAIPEDVRASMTLAASRYCHMVGGRMSDAVRSEISDFQRWGHDRYLETVAAASTAARELGY